MRLYKNISITSSTTQEALTEALKFINSSLESVLSGTKEVSRAQLMAEEALLKLIKHGDFDGVKAIHISIRKFLGKVTVSLTVPGSEFDFVKNLGFDVPLDGEEMTSEAIQNILLRLFMDRLKYKYRNGYNRIWITAAKSAFMSLYWVLGALFWAVVSGIALKNYASPAFCELLSNNVFSPVSTVFMNGLKMCAVPVVFLSIASCVAQFSDLSEIKRIGMRLLVYFVLLQSVSAVIGIGVFEVFQPGRGIETVTANTAPAAGNASFSVINSLVNLMPSNIIRPFIDGDMLQLIVLAVFIGIAVGSLGAKTVRSLLDEGNEIFMKITGVLMRFIPLIIFCSLTSMILTTGYSVVLSLIGIAGTTFAGYAALMVLYYLLVAITCRINPSHLFRKSLPVMLTAFSTSSSVASIPDSIKCAENMGVPSKIYSLSIPLGFSINKNAMTMYTAAASLFMARVYGVEVPASGLVFLLFSTVALVMGAPSVSGSGMIVFSVIMTQLGVPVEAVSLIMGINPVLDMFETSCCCFGNMAATLLTAAHSGMLDTDTYNRA